MQTTIYVLCGGTGIKTGMAFLNQAKQDPLLSANAKRHLHFLVIDSDSKDINTFKKHARRLFGKDFLTANVEVVSLGENVRNLEGPAREIFSFSGVAEKDREIALQRMKNAWWVSDENEAFDGLPRLMDIRKGLGQCPPASFACGWLNLPTIRKAYTRLRSRIAASFTADQLKELQLTLVSSTAGGTGRGLWAPVLLALREEEDDVFPMVMLFDASVFIGSSSPLDAEQQYQVRVNGATGLSEMEAWLRNYNTSSGKRTFLKLPDPDIPSDEKADYLSASAHDPDTGKTFASPANFIYMVFADSERSILSGPDAYYGMVGQALYASQIIPGIGSSLVNKDLQCRFQSLFTSVVCVPFQEIKAYFSGRARKLILDEIGTGNRGVVKNALQGFIEESGLLNPIRSSERVMSPAQDYKEQLNPRVTDIYARWVGVLGRDFAEDVANKLANLNSSIDLESDMNAVAGHLALSREKVEALLPQIFGEPEKDDTVTKGVLDQIVDGVEDASDVDSDFAHWFKGLVRKHVVNAYQSGGGRERSLENIRLFLQALQSYLFGDRHQGGYFNRCLPEAEVAADYAHNKVAPPISEPMKKSALRCFRHELETLKGRKAFFGLRGERFDAGEREALVTSAIEAIAIDSLDELHQILRETCAAVFNECEVWLTNITNCLHADLPALQKWNTALTHDALGACAFYRGAGEGVTFEELGRGVFMDADSPEEAFKGIRADRVYQLVIYPFLDLQDGSDKELLCSNFGDGNGYAPIEAEYQDELDAWVNHHILTKGETRFDRGPVYGELKDIVGSKVKLHQDFLRHHFSLSRTLEKFGEAWRIRLNAVSHHTNKLNELRDLLDRFTGIKFEEEAGGFVGMRQNAITKMLVAHVLGNCRPSITLKGQVEEKAKQLQLYAPNLSSFGGLTESELKEYCKDLEMTVEIDTEPSKADRLTPLRSEFSIVAFSKTAVESVEQVESVEYWREDVKTYKALLAMEQNPFAADGLVFQQNLGYSSPFFIADERMNAMRWKPWAPKIDNKAQEEAMEALLYALFNEGFSEEVAAALAPMREKGWVTGVIEERRNEHFYFKRQGKVLQRESWTDDVETPWDAGDRIGHGVVQLVAFFEDPKNRHIVRYILEEKARFLQAALKVGLNEESEQYRSIMTGYVEALNARARGEEDEKRAVWETLVRKQRSLLQA